MINQWWAVFGLVFGWLTGAWFIWYTFLIDCRYERDEEKHWRRFYEKQYQILLKNDFLNYIKNNRDK